MQGRIQDWILKQKGDISGEKWGDPDQVWSSLNRHGLMKLIS